MVKLKYPPRPTVAEAIRLGARRGAWSTFKHALIREGVIVNFDRDVPLAWKNAFLRANGRPTLKR